MIYIYRSNQIQYIDVCVYIYIYIKDCYILNISIYNISILVTQQRLSSSLPCVRGCNAAAFTIGSEMSGGARHLSWDMTGTTLDILGILIILYPTIGDYNILGIMIL